MQQRNNFVLSNNYCFLYDFKYFNKNLTKNCFLNSFPHSLKQLVLFDISISTLSQHEIKSKNAFILQIIPLQTSLIQAFMKKIDACAPQLKIMKKYIKKLIMQSYNFAENKKEEKQT